MDDISITAIITNYRQYISITDPVMEKISDLHNWSYAHDQIMSWFQSCWEYFVETQIFDGTHFNQSKYRLAPLSQKIEYQIDGKTIKSIYKIIVTYDESVIDLRKMLPLPMNKELRVIGFCTQKNNRFMLKEPYDCVNLIEDYRPYNIYTVNVNKIKFGLKKINWETN